MKDWASPPTKTVGIDAYPEHDDNDDDDHNNVDQDALTESLAGGALFDNNCITAIAALRLDNTVHSSSSSTPPAESSPIRTGRTIVISSSASASAFVIDPTTTTTTTTTTPMIVPTNLNRHRNVSSEQQQQQQQRTWQSACKTWEQIFFDEWWFTHDQIVVVIQSLRHYICDRIPALVKRIRSMVTTEQMFKFDSVNMMMKTNAIISRNNNSSEARYCVTGTDLDGSPCHRSGSVIRLSTTSSWMGHGYRSGGVGIHTNSSLSSLTICNCNNVQYCGACCSSTRSTAAITRTTTATTNTMIMMHRHDFEMALSYDLLQQERLLHVIRTLVVALAQAQEYMKRQLDHLYQLHCQQQHQQQHNMEGGIGGREQLDENDDHAQYQQRLRWCQQGGQQLHRYQQLYQTAARDLYRKQCLVRQLFSNMYNQQQQPGSGGRIGVDVMMNDKNDDDDTDDDATTSSQPGWPNLNNRTAATLPTMSSLVSSSSSSRSQAIATILRPSAWSRDHETSEWYPWLADLKEMKQRQTKTIPKPF